MEHYYYPGIILPMKEKWLDLLLSGKKTVEVRRTSPKIVVERLYLYLRGHIHGYVEVKGYKAGKNPTDARLRQLAKEDARAAMLSQQEFVKYLSGSKTPILYFVANPVRLKKPLLIADRPQNFQYASYDLQKLVERMEKGGEA